MSAPRAGRIHDDLTEDLIESLVGSAAPGTTRGQINERARARQNTPINFQENIVLPGQQSLPTSTGTLWIVDLVLEPQTIAHFFSFLSSGRLPGGSQTALPLLGDDVLLMLKPASEWAPAPFPQTQHPLIENLMKHVALPDNCAVVSKNLHAMKSRLWEGVMPLSNRRWAERKLNEPENFSVACQLITEVLTAFLYLNEPQIRGAFRQVYNLIWDDLRVFENALNAKRLGESKNLVHVTALWAEYMRAHVAHMESRSHAWLTQRLEPLKERVLKDMAEHQPEVISGSESFDEVQWNLTNMWQDLLENYSHADTAVMIPMDGFKGCDSPSATGRPVTDGRENHGTSPLTFTVDRLKRSSNYHMRRRHINLLQQFNDAVRNAGRPEVPLNDSASLTEQCRGQATAQDQARLELRGEPAPIGKESFLLEINEHTEWGFVAYRTFHGGSDEERAKFESAFDADVADWGKELEGADEIRSRSKVHWLDTKVLGVESNDVEALKSHFNDFKETADFPAKFTKNIFLVADEACIKSYLDPTPEPDPTINFLPPGDLGGFILAVDCHFDPKEPREREEESPGYDGTLRVLGSLLWDDLSALLVMQTQGLAELWPLALHHPSKVYVGPVTRAQVVGWTRTRAIMETFLGELDKELSKKE